MKKTQSEKKSKLLQLRNFMFDRILTKYYEGKEVVLVSNDRMRY